MKVESINVALCLIIGKADQGFWGEMDAKTMCYEILEIAKQVYPMTISEQNDERSVASKADSSNTDDKIN